MMESGCSPWKQFNLSNINDIHVVFPAKATVPGR